MELQTLKNGIHALIPSEYYLPVLFLFVLIGALIFLCFVPRLRAQRPNFVLTIVIAVLLVIVMRSSLPDRSGWMLGLLPTLMVAYQAFSVWQSRPREVPGQTMPGTDLREEDYDRVLTRIAHQFSVKSLFMRYGFPAALLAIIGIVVLNVLLKPGIFFSLVTYLPAVVRIDARNATRILLGLRLGAVGAYVFVLMELGRRTFRHDITSGSAMWCLVTLVLGPVLAAAVALLWRIDAPSPEGANWWAGGVVLFFAGYAPRRVIAAIEQAAIQLLKLGGSTVVPTRQVPLTQIRGISSQIEERLSEEGIEDVNALASAEPLRLFRNTSFDLRQILSWIDEAILMITLPRSWQALEEQGITGAIDFVSHEYYLPSPPPDIPSDQAPAWRQQQMKDLADEAKMPVTTLLTTMHRLRDDQQLRYIWALYNRFVESSGGSGTGEGWKVDPEPTDAVEPD